MSERASITQQFGGKSVNVPEDAKSINTDKVTIDQIIGESGIDLHEAKAEVLTDINTTLKEDKILIDLYLNGCNYGKVAYKYSVDKQTVEDIWKRHCSTPQGNAEIRELLMTTLKNQQLCLIASLQNAQIRKLTKILANESALEEINFMNLAAAYKSNVNVYQGMEMMDQQKSLTVTAEREPTLEEMMNDN